MLRLFFRVCRTDAIRFALDSSTPTGSEPLVSRVVERTIAVLQGGGKGRDDYSVLVRREQVAVEWGRAWCHFAVSLLFLVVK